MFTNSSSNSNDQRFTKEFHFSLSPDKNTVLCKLIITTQVPVEDFEKALRSRSFNSVFPKVEGAVERKGV